MLSEVINHSITTNTDNPITMELQKQLPTTTIEHPTITESEATTSENITYPQTTEPPITSEPLVTSTKEVIQSTFAT